MLAKPIRIPDSTHPITVEPNVKRIVVKAAGHVLADSARALALQECGRPAVIYIPRVDVRLDALERSQTASYCPYKGEAHHYDIAAESTRITNACWSYDEPYWAVAEIERHIAFDPSRIDCIEEL
jgi:uncharacterized protein (DUF427 family)